MWPLWRHTQHLYIIKYIYIQMRLLYFSYMWGSLRLAPIMLMLRWYNCTGINIVKYKQCIAFGNIYTGCPFFALVREKSHKRPQKVAQVAVCCHSEHHAVFVGCQHQRYPSFWSWARVLGHLQGNCSASDAKQQGYCLTIGSDKSFVGILDCPK